MPVDVGAWSIYFQQVDLQFKISAHTQPNTPTSQVTFDS